jgi:hypothetical protein
MGIGDWGLGIGDWGCGPKPQTPNPQPPTQYNLYNLYTKKINLFILNI